MTPADETPFFTHRSPRPIPDRVELKGTTRYLCGAAYLSDDFPRRITDELIDNEHRAIAPSVGFDLGPVLRHCYRARSLLLYRDAALTVILLLGFLLSPSPGIWLVAVTALMIGAALWSRHRRVAVGIAVSMALGLALLPALLAGAFISQLGGGSYTNSHDVLPDPAGESSGGTSMSGLVLRAAVLYLLAVAVHTAWRLTVYRVLTDELAADGLHRLPEVPTGRVRTRIQAISAAQWGNLALHAHHDPFLGAGQVLHSWSMSLELRGTSAEPTTVDPVALQRHVRDRLEAMCGENLPARERIASLIVLDHIVATGDRSVPDSLNDPTNRIP